MKSRLLRVASFALAFAAYVGTVAAHGYWVIGEALRDNVGIAIPTTLSGIALAVAANSFIPGLVVAALSLRWCMRDANRLGSLLFSICFLSAWSWSAFQTAWSYRGNFGNTWTTLEILLGLVWQQGWTGILIAAGLITNFCLHVAWQRFVGRDDAPR